MCPVTLYLMRTTSAAIDRKDLPIVFSQTIYEQQCVNFCFFECKWPMGESKVRVRSTDRAESWMQRWFMRIRCVVKLECSRQQWQDATHMLMDKTCTLETESSLETNIWFQIWRITWCWWRHSTASWIKPTQSSGRRDDIKWNDMQQQQRNFNWSWIQDDQHQQGNDPTSDRSPYTPYTYW